jgi:hypothetical protein
MKRPVEVVPKMIGSPELRLVLRPSGSAKAGFHFFLGQVMLGDVLHVTIWVIVHVPDDRRLAHAASQLSAVRDYNHRDRNDNCDCRLQLPRVLLWETSEDHLSGCGVMRSMTRRAIL